MKRILMPFSWKRDVADDDDAEDDDNRNLLYSPVYADNVLNNWCDLVPLWACLHLKDQGSHGKSKYMLSGQPIKDL